MNSDRDTRTIRKNDVTVVPAPEGKSGFLCVGCGLTFGAADMHKHHCVPHSDGGRTARWNVILICDRCHALIHLGHTQDTEIGARINFFMMARYGLLMIIRQPEMRSELRDIKESRPLWWWRRLNADIKRYAQGMLDWYATKPKRERP